MSIETIIQLVIQAAILIVVLIQSKIMNSQIQKSNTIISHMEAYTRLIDIKKLEEYVALNEKRFELKNKQLEETLKEDLNKATSDLKEQASILRKWYAESIFALALLLVERPQDEAEQFIDNHLKQTKARFRNHYHLFLEAKTMVDKGIELTPEERKELDALLSET